ncbi:MAG: TolC family protein [Candidatus Marinimicrobia bacterium]|nr:TolC family protein [Candidatus Neomarinimicrobiota bacterium]
MKAVFFFILSFLVSIANLSAQVDGRPSANPVNLDTLAIDINTAIVTGLENNPTILVKKIAPVLSETAVKEQKGVFDPTVTASVQRSQSQSQRRLGASANPFDIKDTTTTATVGIQQALPTGTRINFTGGMSGSVSNLYTDQYASNLDLTVTQSLLQGFGLGANLANIRKAQIDVDITESELKGVAEAVTADIEAAYWNLYLTAQEIQIQTSSLALAQKQLQETRERVNVGKLADLELAAVSAEVAARRSQLIDAESRHEQARLRFIYLVFPNQPAVWERYPLPLDTPALPADSLDPVGVHTELGLKYRPDLIQARLGLQKQDLAVTQTRNGLLPKLDLFISLGKTNYAATFADATPDLGSPYMQMSTGLNFTMPVPNRQSSAQLARARVSREQQELAVGNMEKQVILDIRSKYVEVLRTRQQVEATLVTRQLQEEKLLAEQEKFRVGKSTNILVLQAQRDFTASQLDEARSVVAYLNALMELYVSEGTLLERRGIASLEG